MAIKIDTQCEWILHVQDEPERAAVRATVRATVRASINAVGLALLGSPAK